MDWDYQELVEQEMDEIRNKALKIAQAVNPEIPCVVDDYTLDDYCDKRWEYPGKWYCYFRLPNDVKTKQELIDKIARETIACFNKQ